MSTKMSGDFCIYEYELLESSSSAGVGVEDREELNKMNLRLADLHALENQRFQVMQQNFESNKVFAEILNEREMDKNLVFFA